MWSLGVILCNLAFGRNPWAQAVMTDATFAAYAANPAYLSAILPASPAVARILTGPRGLFSLDPRRRMSIPELRAEVQRTTRWLMTEDEVRFASAEARSVASVIKNAVRERDARLMAQQQQQQVRRAVPEVRQQQQQLPQIIVPAAAPASTPAPAPVRPSIATANAAHGRNSSLRLVLQKVAAPFTSSSRSSSSSAATTLDSHYQQHAGAHLRRPSAAPTDNISTYSSSSSSSLNSPMPLTPPASSYNSAVDVVQPGNGVAYVWPGSSVPKTGGGARDWNYDSSVNVVPVVARR